MRRIEMHRAAVSRLRTYRGPSECRELVALLADPRLILIPTTKRAEHERDVLAVVARWERMSWETGRAA